MRLSLGLRSEGKDIQKVSRKAAPVGAAASINLDDAVAHSVQGEIGDGMQIEFSHEVCAMSLGGFYAQAKGRGNLFGGFPLSD
jgi:hypothetical protein